MLFVRTVVFSILIAAGLVVAQNDPGPDKSHLDFTEQSFDFGILESDSLVSHIFHFKNTGRDTIEIYNVGSS